MPENVVLSGSEYTELVKNSQKPEEPKERKIEDKDYVRLARLKAKRIFDPLCAIPRKMM